MRRARFSSAPELVRSVVTSTSLAFLADFSLRRPFTVSLSDTVTVPALLATVAPRATSNAGEGFLWCFDLLVAAKAGSVPFSR